MKNKASNGAATVGVPYMLSFAGVNQFKPGRGDAGWTVARVPVAEVGAFLAALPRESWMPGTYRIAEGR